MWNRETEAVTAECFAPLAVMRSHPSFFSGIKDGEDTRAPQRIPRSIYKDTYHCSDLGLINGGHFSTAPPRGYLKNWPARLSSLSSGRGRLGYSYEDSSSVSVDRFRKSGFLPSVISNLHSGEVRRVLPQTKYSNPPWLLSGQNSPFLQHTAMQDYLNSYKGSIDRTVGNAVYRLNRIGPLPHRHLSYTDDSSDTRHWSLSPDSKYEDNSPYTTDSDDKECSTSDYCCSPTSDYCYSPTSDVCYSPPVKRKRECITPPIEEPYSPPGIIQSADDLLNRIFAEVCIDEPDGNDVGTPECSRRRTRGEKTGDSMSHAAPLLPPCRVCGEKASGFHYGANTCEACKGFFRRSLARKEDYKCIGSEDCEIGVGKRNVCAFCRYQKCLSIGMSKSAIKTGRYTHEKKTRDIEEVKRLQQAEKSRSLGLIVGEPPAKRACRDAELEQIIKHITSVHNQQTPHTKEFFEKLPEKENEFLEQRKLQQEMFGTLKPISRDEYMQIYQTTGLDVDGRREMIKHMIPCIEKAIKRFIAFAKALPGFKDLPIDDQIALIKASRFEAWFLASHKAFNPEHRLYTHVCGYTVHVEEMTKFHDMEFLEATFLLAKRIKSLKLTTEEECVIKGIAILSRASRLEVWLIIIHKQFNNKTKIFSFPDGSKLKNLHMQDLMRVQTEDFLSMTFALAEKLQSIKLSVEEVCIFSAVTMMSTDRTTLRCPEQVEKAQEVLVEAFEYLIKKNHPDKPYLFASLIVLLAEYRTVRHLQIKFEKINFYDWHEDIHFPPLFYEMWSSYA